MFLPVVGPGFRFGCDGQGNIGQICLAYRNLAGNGGDRIIVGYIKSGTVKDMKFLCVNPGWECGFSMSGDKIAGEGMTGEQAFCLISVMEAAVLIIQLICIDFFAVRCNLP